MVRGGGIEPLVAHPSILRQLIYSQPTGTPRAPQREVVYRSAMSIRSVMGAPIADALMHRQAEARRVPHEHEIAMQGCAQAVQVLSSPWHGMAQMRSPENHKHRIARWRAEGRAAFPYEIIRVRGADALREWEHLGT